MVRNSPQFDDVTHAHIGVGHSVLFNKRHAPRQLLFGNAGNVLSVQRHAPGIRAAQTCQYAQQRGFTAAVRAKQAHRFAPGNLQRNMIHNDLFTYLRVIFSAQMLITYSLSGR